MLTYNQYLLDKGTRLLEQFLIVRSRTEVIVSPLHKEDYNSQPVVFVSPAKWHLAHTTWFFEEFVLAKQPNYKPFDERYSYYFNSYYNNVGERVNRNQRGSLTRPSVKRVIEYRQFVTKQIQDLLVKNSLDGATLKILELGINHEQQHQELLITDLKYSLGVQPFDVAYAQFHAHTAEQNESWVMIEEGLYEVGHDGEGFSFDNERSQHKFYLNSYEISSSLVTNQQYKEFIENGGYKDFNFWHEEGWAWVQQEKAQRPLYWKEELEKHYTLEGLKPLIPEAPVSHINFYEASAFATWKEMRLPSEQEWEIASDQFHWGQRWEWCSSAFIPYPGFRKAPGALGEYNGKFMVNQQVLRGSSIATAHGHSRKTYRNFFHPQLQWQFTGIRLAR